MHEVEELVHTEVEDLVHTEVAEALAPLRDRLDDLERTVLETIVRLASRSSTTSPAPSGATPEPSDTTPAPRSLDAWFAGLVGDERHRRVILALAGGVFLGVGMLSMLLAACR